MPEESASYPLILSPNEGARYLAGVSDGQPNRAEFLRFVERFSIPPIDEAGSSRDHVGIIVRRKWSRRHIDLCLLTGLPFPEALEWARKANISIN